MAWLDSFLDRITMYRLVLYLLIAYLLLAMGFGALGVIGVNPIAIALSVAFMLLVGVTANRLFASVYQVPVNVESVYITVLILALIIDPATSFSGFMFLGWAALLAVATKFILNLYGKHFFNPAALAVVLTSVGFGGAASWWVGNLYLTPFVALGGYLVVHKIRRQDMCTAFLLSAFASVFFFSFMRGGSFFSTLTQLLFHSSLFFLGTIMLTEPLTTPPTKDLQIAYGALTGFLFSPQVHLGSLYSTPELALVVANFFAYLASPKQKLLLTLKQKHKLTDDIIEYIFTPSAKLAYQPGQYMEWTLPHNHPDSRGNRRYFTLSSSPTEPNLRLGVRFYPHGSSFKQTLENLDHQTPLLAGSLAGDFTLPSDPHQKLVFIAGGIGITPFRSMLKYLLDLRQPRDIVLFYTSKHASDFVYTDVIAAAHKQIGLRAIATLTDTASIPDSWSGEQGRLTPEMVVKYAPDYQDRRFYLSGPHALVVGFQEVLKHLGVPTDQVITDYFPGFV